MSRKKGTVIILDSEDVVDVPESKNVTAGEDDVEAEVIGDSEDEDEASDSEVISSASSSSSDDDEAEAEGEEPEQPLKRPRGRPPKVREEPLIVVEEAEVFEEPAQSQIPGMHDFLPSTEGLSSSVGTVSYVINPSSSVRRRALFLKEVGFLMYGFGDVVSPAPETVALMEELLQDFLVDLCVKASKYSKRPKTSDFLAALAPDHKKAHRARELLALDKELKAARSVFDVNEMAKGQGTADGPTGAGASRD